MFSIEDVSHDNPDAGSPQSHVESLGVQGGVRGLPGHGEVAAEHAVTGVDDNAVHT